MTTPKKPKPVVKTARVKFKQPGKKKERKEVKFVVTNLMLTAHGITGLEVVLHLDPATKAEEGHEPVKALTVRPLFDPIVFEIPSATAAQQPAKAKKPKPDPSLPPEHELGVGG